MLEYRSLLPMYVEVGAKVNVEGRSWFCLETCTVGGYTSDGVPVIRVGDGPTQVATTQFILEENCQSPPEKGRVRVENLEMMRYQQIKPSELVDKRILSVQFNCDEFIIVTTDMCYVRVENGRHGELELEPINMVGLRGMGLISLELFQQYLDEKQAGRTQVQDTHDVCSFKTLVDRLGKEQAIKLLDSIK